MKMIDKILGDNKYNSLTKYPSILTYHVMDAGKLQNMLNYPEQDRDLTINISEKIDGTNTRILIYNNDYVIGSREDWIYAKGDRAITSSLQSIINFMANIAEGLIQDRQYKLDNDTLYCIYGELYGSKIQKASSRYTTTKDTYGYRIFDMWKMNEAGLQQLDSTINDANNASLWRENNSQPWFSDLDLSSFIKTGNSILVSVPQYGKAKLSDIPADIQSTYEYLLQYQRTQAELDNSLKKNTDAEGIIIRTKDRGYITKLRFEDYKKTLKKNEIDKRGEEWN